MRLTLRDRALDDLALAQHRVVTRGQLTDLGITARTVESQIAAERWLPVTPTTVLLANAPTTGDQLCWVAVLNAPQPCALASTTALQLHGMTGLVDDPEVHVVVGRDTMTSAIHGVRVHESRRFDASDVMHRRGLPVCTPERAAIDAAAWQRSPRYVYAVVPAVVQQRIGRVERLRAELERAGRVRHARHLRLAIADVEGGAEALSEIDLGRMCRRHRLAPPHRQRVRRDPSGRRRYLDAEWRRPDLRLVVLEVDGGHHAAVEHWEADMRRERRVVLDGQRIVLRCSAREVRLDTAALVEDLRDAGVPTIDLSVRGDAPAS